MSYIKTTWVTGDIVTAPRMNNIEGGIYNNDAAVTELQSEVTDTQSDVSTLQTNVSTLQTNVSTLQSNVSTLQTNVTNLQTVTGNLVPSIADVFSTSSTYAVGDHVMYNGRLYECKTAVTSAGAWNALAWEAVSVFKYDDVVGVIKITHTSTTMATIETTLAEINTANDHIVFDVSALSAGMHLCTIYLSDGKYRITDLATGFDGEGLYSGTDTLVSILQKGSAPFYNVSTEPYTFRPIESGVGNKEALDKLIGGSLAWNQLNNYGQNSGTNNGVTYTKTANGWTVSGTASSSNQSQFRTTTDIPCVSGHRYLCIANAVLSTNGLYVIIWRNNSATRAATIGQNAAEKLVMFTGGSDWTNLNIWFHVAAGKTASNTNLVVNLFDLTAMFGSTIADYVYGLERATAGAGVAWLSQYIDLSTYHAYDAGSIQSVQATAHVTTGKNLMPQQTDGIIPCFLPKGAHICASCTTPTGATPNLNYYDANRNRIDYWPLTQTYSGGLYRSFVVAQDAYYIAFTNNTAQNKQLEFGTSPTAYEPYTEHVYPLGSDTLRGIPQLVSNKLAFDGDEKYPDGTIRRKYGIVDLGSLTWTYNNASGHERFIASVTPQPRFIANNVAFNGVCAKYEVVSNGSVYDHAKDKIIGINDAYQLAVYDSAYTNAATFKTAMSGVYLVYELATSATESSTAYQRVQEAPQGGTEAFIANTIVPVGHYTRYPGNMLAAVELVGDDKEEDPIYSEDSTPYTLRKVENRGVAGKCALNKLVGGSLGWNQMIPTTGASKTDAGVTFTNNGNGTWTVTGTSTATTVFANLDYVANTVRYISGHVYFIGGSGSNVNIQIVASGTYASITATGQTIQKFSASSITASWARLHVATSGTTVNTTVTPQIIDLTQMFGSTIADYVYGLESATAGAGIAWLSQYIDLSTYHAYDAGSIQSVQATAHVTIGFNQWNEAWEIGEIYASTGEEASSTTTWRTKSYIPVIGGTQYYLGCTGHSGFGSRPRFYDGAKNYIGYTPKTGNAKFGTIFTVPDNCAYMRFCPFLSEIPTDSPITLNISKPTGTPKNGDYVPYSAHTYPLGSDTLRGTPQLVSNKLSYDGDEKYPDGTIRRKYGIVDLGSLDWTYADSSGRSFFTALTTTISPSVKLPIDNTYAIKAIIAGYDAASMSTVFRDRNFGADAPSSGNRLLICDNRYTTAAAFKTAVTGQYMVYELQTPATESSTPYQRVQTVYQDGTESFTTSTPVPVDHYSQYAENILAEIDAIGDGLDDTGEEKAVQIPNSAITIVESGASIVENGLHIYKNMVSGWLVIKRGTGYAQTSSHIATIDSRYIPKTRQRMVAGEGYNAYDIQGVAYTFIPPQGEANAGQLWATQNSTSRPHLFIHLDYTI